MREAFRLREARRGVSTAGGSHASTVLLYSMLYLRDG